MHLSKSLYTRGLQCVKFLWLKKYKKDVLTPPDASAQAIFETGNLVGDLACQLFPNGVEIPYEGTTHEDKIIMTQDLINQGIKHIYEATFQYEGILVMVDILTIEDDIVTINEVKSSTAVKDVYLDDASIQYYVLNGLGYDVQRVNIIHINNAYIRGDELEIHKLFSIVDVSPEVLEKQCNIPSYLEEFRKFLLDKENEPNIDIGKHCSHPYECDAMEYCWCRQKQIPEYSIFNISRLKSDKKFELYQKGILHFHQIPDISSFSLSQQIQITSELEQKEIINKEAIQSFLSTLTYPVYHLDFETFQQPVPLWKGINSFMQIPFQYSIHIDYGDGRLEHKEFLGDENSDPREALAKQLVEDIPSNVTVIAYNMGFEKGVIRKLAQNYPDLHGKLINIHDNIKDLMTPFQTKDYYHPNMKGSYSIKQVLPSLVPEMAKAYKELNLVHHGGEAMQTFANLPKMDQETRKAYRNALLEYCKLDTLAMVKVLEKLKESMR
ncbi:MAG: DUF2779 domain-containing protein [Campylobacterales bacterium]|nr:DUF2779 domain-containing protein [Campylobacterales bacterium]